jgi:hypothetical protein
MPYDWFFFTLDDEHSVTKCEQDKSRVVIIFNIKAYGLTIGEKADCLTIGEEEIDCKFDTEFTKIMNEKNKELFKPTHFCELSKGIYKPTPEILDLYKQPFIGVILNKEYAPESDNNVRLSSIRDLDDLKLVHDLLTKYKNKIKRSGLVNIKVFSEFHSRKICDDCNCGVLKIVHDTIYKTPKCTHYIYNGICDCVECVFAKKSKIRCNCYYIHRQIIGNQFPEIETDELTNDEIELMVPLVCKWDNYDQLHKYLEENNESRGDCIEENIWGNQGNFDIYKTKKVAFIIELEQQIE